MQKAYFSERDTTAHRQIPIPLGNSVVMSAEIVRVF